MSFRLFACRWALLPGLLAACDSRPAATTPPGAPATTLPPAAAHDAAGSQLVTLTPQDTLLAAGRREPEKDVSAQDEPVELVRKTAGGLTITVTSAPGAGGAAGPNPGDLRIVLAIRRGGQLIYQDSTGDGLTYTEFSEPSSERLYPIWVPTGPGAGELLLAYNNRPSRDRARRFFIRGNEVVKLDTLPTFDEPARDLDRDGRPEYHGLPDYGEQWTDEQGRQRATYNPTLYYERRPGGLVLDSTLTIRKARAQYGRFYGFRYSEQPVILAR